MFKKFLFNKEIFIKLFAFVLIEFDPFESLPLSQTDVLMDTVDIDQLFSKDQNPVDVNRVPNEVKTSTTKSTVSIGKKIINKNNKNMHFSKRNVPLI